MTSDYTPLQEELLPKGFYETWKAESKPSRLPEINVGTVERWVSGLLGGALGVYGLSRRSIGGGLLGLLGGMLLYRSLTGRCAAYRAMGIRGADARPTSHPLSRQINIQQSVAIHRPPAEVYRFWRDFENLPRFMHNLHSVTVLNDKQSRWAVRGPGGRTIEWTAEITEDQDSQQIAWRTLPFAPVSHRGSVRFTPVLDGQGTLVTVSLAYQPPAGALGAMFAKLLGADPNREIRQDLLRLQQMLETRQPAPAESEQAPRVL